MKCFHFSSTEKVMNDMKNMTKLMGVFEKSSSNSSQLSVVAKLNQKHFNTFLFFMKKEKQFDLETKE